MNGNITKDGIRKDLEWMHRSGIGGFQNFDAGLTTPQIVKERLVYMTPGWKDAFRFAAKLADSLHLEMAIAGSPGWSESGGPWVPAKDGMKKIVWSRDTGERWTGFYREFAKTFSYIWCISKFTLSLKKFLASVQKQQHHPSIMKMLPLLHTGYLRQMYQ
jgi:hypothetical protein